MKSTAMIVALIISSSAMMSGCVTALVAGGVAATAAGVANVAGDRRTFGSQFDDEMIESVVLTEIENIDTIGYSKSHIGATSIDGYLLVHGQTPSQLIKEGIPKTCLKIKGVKSVHNAVTVEENIGLSQRSNDTWITSKVKSKLLGTSNISSNRFKVVTENGVVYLMGLVTRDEGNRAAQIAADTDGVVKVVKLYQYINDDKTINQEVKKSDADSSAKVNVPAADVLTSDTIEVSDL